MSFLKLLGSLVKNLKPSRLVHLHACPFTQLYALRKGSGSWWQAVMLDTVLQQGFL